MSVSQTESFTLSAPATTANLGPAFDTLGAALELRNELVFVPYRPFSVRIFGEGSNSLERSENNLVVKAYLKAFEIAGREPIEGAFVLKNRIPLARGLGSSAAAAVLGAGAAAEVMGFKAEEKDELITKTAVELEGHPDNVIPCYYGGIRLCVQTALLTRSYALKLPTELKILLVIPRKRISTVTARKVLGKKVELKNAVFNLQRTALLVWSLENNCLDFLKEATADALHQEKRLGLIQNASKLFQSILAHDLCVAGWLSGSGSSLAFAYRRADEAAFVSAAERILQKNEFEARLLTVEFASNGLELIVS
jgi:homoserine kinase